MDDYRDMDEYHINKLVRENNILKTVFKALVNTGAGYANGKSITKNDILKWLAQTNKIPLEELKRILYDDESSTNTEIA